MALNAFSSLSADSRRGRGVSTISSGGYSGGFRGGVYVESQARSSHSSHSFPTQLYVIQPQQAHFCSSSSQTTFLDRNIVQNLAVAAAAPLTAHNSTSRLSAATTTSLTQAGGAGSVGGAGGTGGVAHRRRRPRTVPASYTSGSESVKRASFSGTLPDGGCK